MRVCLFGVSLSWNEPARQSMRGVVAAIWLAAELLWAIGPAMADPDMKRVALVIGNADYAHAPKLSNPRNDARLVAESLAAAGFTIIDGAAQLDLEVDAMREAVRSFGRALDANTVAVLYYSGHGIEYQGENYLIPIDANPTATDVYDLVRVSDLMRAIEQKHNGMAIVILDACRTNAFPKGTKDLEGGLAQMQAPRGTLIAFATQPGASAQDGADGNSPYALALADEIHKPGVDVFNTFNEVARRVDDATGHLQTPWLSSSPIAGRFYFTPPATSPPTATDTGEAPSQPGVSHEAILPPAPRPAPAPIPAAVPIAPPPKVMASDPGGEVFKECEECPEMVVVPAGEAMLGSPPGESGRQTFDAAPHLVEISKPFAVGRYAITFAEWDACFAEGGCGHRRLGDLDFGRGRRPAIFATWNQAQLYVQWLKRQTGQPYRLLSEAEWEYAARGCNSLKCAYAPFWFGAIKPELAVYDSRRSYDGSPKAVPTLQTAPVENGQPNPFGLYNMLGNVRQWTQDCWNPRPEAAPSNGAPLVAGDCTARATRGGSWADEPAKLRAAARDYESVDEGSEKIGFRVARDLTQ